MVRCRRALPLLLVAAAAAVVKASAAAPQAALERPRTIGTGQRVPYQAWSEPIKAGVCRKVALANAAGVITCTVTAGNIKSYQFPAGVFEISEQLLVPPNVSITGNAGPNDLHRPTKSPDWQTQTLFLATRGSTDYKKNYCHAQDMVTTRVGFVLSSFVTVRNVSCKLPPRSPLPDMPLTPAPALKIASANSRLYMRLYNHLASRDQPYTDSFHTNLCVSPGDCHRPGNRYDQTGRQRWLVWGRCLRDKGMCGEQLQELERQQRRVRWHGQHARHHRQRQAE